MKKAKPEEKIMTLEEAISQLEDGRIFKIGGSQGSAFIFIGRKNDFELKLNELNEKSKRQAKRLLEETLNKYEKLAIEDHSLNSYVFNILRSDKKNKTGMLHGTKKSALSIDGYEEFIKKWMKELQTLRDTALHLEKLICTPIEKRKIKEQYRGTATIDEDSEIFLIDGYEVGTLWTIKEAFKSKEEIEEDTEDEVPEHNS